MNSTAIAAFECPPQHVAISEIIRRRSTNPLDVREAAVRGLSLGRARRILDLGCGFGFMTGAVARRAAADAVVVGVDACAANEEPYLDCIAETGRAGRYVCRVLDSRLAWPDGSFDAVICSYALYFFPGIVPEVARVLAPHGVFVAVTHAESSCRELLQAIGASAPSSGLMAYVRSFSAENGSDLLGECFDQVERIDYSNALVFEAAHEDELLAYLQFKLPFLSPTGTANGAFSGSLSETVRQRLARDGRVVLQKSDAVFHCRGPLGR